MAVEGGGTGTPVDAAGTLPDISGINFYATVEDVKTRVGETTTDNDALLAVMLDTASRLADAICHRHFYLESATRYFDTGPENNRLMIDDVLTISALTTDSDADGTFDGETWTEGDANDFILWPYNEFPKMQVRLSPAGDFAFAKNLQKNVKIIGLWGYGDGKSITPYKASGITVTVVGAVATTVTVSAEGTLERGHTILAGTEQMFIVGASNDGSRTIEVERGVNGTTAAAHDGVAANIYQYPSMVNQAVLVAAAETFDTMGSEGYANEKIGDYSYGRLTNAGKAMLETILLRYLGPFRRLIV